MSHISSLGQSVIMMGGGPTAKFFKGVSAELANLWKHKQIFSNTFNISFWVFTKKKTRLKKQKKTYGTLNITIFKLSTAEVNTLKKKKNTFFCQENINHNASLKKRLLAFFWTILKTTFFLNFSLFNTVFLKPHNRCHFRTTYIHQIFPGWLLFVPISSTWSQWELSIIGTKSLTFLLCCCTWKNNS